MVHATESLRGYCFQCIEGHVHLKWDNVVLSFSPSEFSCLAQLVKAMDTKLREHEPVLMALPGEVSSLPM
ncbi:MAG TPA: hypothetical protein PLB32_24360 [Acidobacteriota bacterium]|nr:hypothetical protein [Acidobacteriota bacterium]